MPKANQNQMPDVTQLADLYVQLARMEEVGISHVHAFKNLAETGNTLSSKLHRVISYLNSGRSISESGCRSGLFKEVDRELISAGELSGKLGDIYRQLAGYYSDKARRIRKIKSRLFLPLTILLLALLIQPIPALFVGSISIKDYILSSVGVFVYILLVLYIFWRLPYWLTEGSLRMLGLGQIVFQLQLTLPLTTP